MERIIRCALCGNAMTGNGKIYKVELYAPEEGDVAACSEECARQIQANHISNIETCLLRARKSVPQVMTVDDYFGD